MHDEVPALGMRGGAAALSTAPELDLEVTVRSAVDSYEVATEEDRAPGLHIIGPLSMPWVRTDDPANVPYLDVPPEDEAASATAPPVGEASPSMYPPGAA